MNNYFLFSNVIIDGMEDGSDAVSEIVRIAQRNVLFQLSHYGIVQFNHSYIITVRKGTDGSTN